MDVLPFSMRKRSSRVQATMSGPWNNTARSRLEKIRKIDLYNVYRIYEILLYVKWKLNVKATSEKHDKLYFYLL